MNFKHIIILVFFTAVFNFVAPAQVTFTHTLNADFNKGITENVLVKNDGLALPSKKASINDWTSTTNLPQNLSGHQMVVWRSYVFLTGGYNGTKYNNLVYRAPVNSAGIGGWTQLNSLPDSVGFHAMVATSTKLYVFGGKKGDLPSNKIFVATINDDGSLGTWQQSTISLPQSLWGLTAQFINGFIYIAGGTSQAGLTTAVNTVYYSKIDAEDNLTAFLTATTLPEARNGHSMSKYNGKLYILGGYDNAGVRKTTVYYTTINANGSCGSWLSATPLPVAVSNHVSTCSNGIITVIGGEENTILSNKFYFADIDNAPALTWELSDRYLYDRAKNSSAFSADNQIIYTGGAISTGALVNTIRYVSLVSSVNKVKKGIFISAPFVVGAPKNIQKLTYNIAIQTGDTYELLYRLAGADKIWGDWVSAGTTNPATINQVKSYIQYMFRLNANSTNDLVIPDITLTISGYTQLCGNLDAMTTLTSAASPYWATCDVTFTTGSHIIQSGVTIVFSPNTGLTIGQASVSFNGTQALPVKLTAYDSLDGSWNGVYFTDASDAGVSSQMNYTTIEKGGNGGNNANLWCYSTNQPVVNNCTFRKAVGYGVRMEYSNFILNNTMISDNTESGLYLHTSNPILNNVTTRNSGYAGIYYATLNLNPSYSFTKSENNLYGLYSPTPDVSFAPESSSTLQMLNNTTDIAVAGGVIYTSRTWKFFPNGYTILGNITVNQNGTSPVLTIGPGTKMKFFPGVGLYIGGGSSTGGQLYAVGKADSLITFTAYNNAVGGWTGLYFNDGSDYNSTSSLRYCVVEKGNEYNIFSVNSNEPHIMFSTIRNSVTYGVKLQNANINIEETTIKKAQHGLYLDNSSPSLILSTIDSIQTYCVWLANATAVPTYSQCNMKNSLYGIYYPNPNFTVPTYSNITFSNLTASIAMNGGNISNDQTWNNNLYGFALFDNVSVYGPRNGSKARLTINPGCTIKLATGKNFQIGNEYYGWYLGEMHVLGTASLPVTFTSLDGTNGGWNGIYYHNATDESSNTSVLNYCTVEKGNQYNIWCNNTSQPSISNCIFRFALNQGVFFEAAPVTMSNSTVSYNAGIGVNSTNSLLTLSNLIIQNNGNYGIYYNSAHYVKELWNLQISGNLKNGVVIGGGNIYESRIWRCFGNTPYIITDNMQVYGPRSSTKATLTIRPGCILKFAAGKNLQVGNESYGWYYGELNAVGKSDSLITFTALNDSSGGWNGIYFHNATDESANLSQLTYCTIQKGNQYNLWCNNTSQPTISNCTFNYALNQGVFFEAAPVTMTNTTISNNFGIGINSTNSLLTLSNLVIQNNGNYGIYYNSAHYVKELWNLQISGNLKNGVVIGGGNMYESRIWRCFGNTPYIITDNMQLYGPRSSTKATLTIRPGCTLKFAVGKNLQVGYEYYGWYFGELNAIGTSDSLISFTAMNDSIGGWNGIYFHNATDEAGSFSTLKYSKISKASQYNIWCNNTTQPTLEKVTISESAGYGLWLDAANVTVKNSIIRNNLGYGVYLTAGSIPVIGNNYITSCDIFSNAYNIYNNTANNIDMRYNFLGSCDSSYIAKKIWDKADNSSLGRITFTPYSWLPAAQQNAINFSGNFLYQNKTPFPTVILSNSTLTIKDYSNNNTIASTLTNGTGSFSFSPLTLSVPTKIEFNVPQLFGGVNSTDALVVMQHFTWTSLLTGNHLSVADVNRSNTVNGTDAMMIMQRFAGSLASFPAGSMEFDCDSVILNNPAFNYNLTALWYGDANGSYPVLNKTPGISIIYEDIIHVGSWQEFNMRVKIKNKLDVGAISLAFNYPFEFLDVLGVKLISTGENLLFTAQEGLLKTGWYNLNPIVTMEDDVLVSIRFKAKDLSYQSAPISISLDSDSELADQFANPHGGVILSAPVIPATLTGIGQGEGDEANFSFMFYPNPATNGVTFTYALPETGNVTLTITDLPGRTVVPVADEEQTEGKHRQFLDVSALTRGIYLCHFQYTSGERITKITRKLVVN